MLTLKNRTAILNGANGIVGTAIIRQMLDGGMNVITWHGRPDKAAMMEERYREYSDRFMSYGGSDDQGIMGKIQDRFGGIDVIIAGQGFPPINQNITEITADYWHSVVRSNMFGSMPIIQNALPYLKKSKAPRIVFLSSAEALSGGFYDGLAYTAAKGGIISMNYSLARRLAGDGITVNTVAMGGIYNMEAPVPGEPKKDDIPDYSDTDLVTKVPLGRLGRPEDVSIAVSYLISEEASFVTGQVISVSGGLTIGC